MACKTVLLPREWNSPDVPPDTGEDVIVKLEDGSISVAYYGHGWHPSNVCSTDDMVQFDCAVIGWAMIIQQ